MTEPSDRPAASDAPTQPQETALLRDMLRTPGYLKALVLSGLIGIPISLVAFWFLAGLQELEHVLWADLPQALGWDTSPSWWPLPLLLVAGVIVGLVVTHLPGAGGHIPASGLHAGGASTAALPGVVIAAAASLPLGAVLGPEAPLIALGGGLALLFRDLARAPATAKSTALLGAAGAAAAISVIFGSPLIAAVLLIEVAGVGGPQLFAIMLPALLSSGVGALVFTGFGRWTGLDTGSLALKFPESPPRLDTGDVFWSILMAVAIAVLMHLSIAGGRLTAAFVAARTFTRTVVCAVAAGGCAALYAVITGRTPVDVASSGQATLADMASDPHAWGVGALLAVVLFKSLAYALCLGSLRGGPVFPSLFLGAAVGVLLSPLPGLGVVPGVAGGMAAALTSVLRLPVSSVVLVVVLLGNSATVPVVILAAVVALVTTELLPAVLPSRLTRWRSDSRETR
ncbi:chloride channel protein [Streptomyces lunaelactis]|uniref:chloride channel protein n=1 Tax=Streptomyces lunaelactis TaxID=1535768 RepID=UPI001584DDB1|nr:chloride channel protein [Streptomyces lunaelactis]NUK48968.1 chloride channel protein [Streptomyces lunaelactis]NUK63037.1 chloride channel protein [Streptomyces lunaelactis]